MGRTWTRLAIVAAFLGLWLGVACGGGADSSGSASGAGIQITITPAAVELHPNESKLFTAKVTGTTQTTVTWSTVGTGSGAFTGSTGLYTAPSTPGIYTIMAALGADPSIATTATVVVTQKTPVLVRIYPDLAEVGMGQSTTFSANVTEATGAVVPDQRVTWSVIGGSANGSFSGATGLFTAPTRPGTYTIMATSVADPLQFDTAVVNVINTTPGIKITITPASATLKPGQSLIFEAKVEGTSNQLVTWKAMGDKDPGTITESSGLYTAPSTPGVYTVSATSVADPTRVSTAQVVVSNTENITVSITPKSPAAIVPGASITFAAAVEGTNNKAVKWVVVGGDDNGTFVGNTGLYVAPLNPGTYTILAYSLADPSRFDSAQVTVSTSSLPVVVAVYPPTVSLTPGATFTFTATVSGSYNTTVIWSIDSGNGNVDKTRGVFTAPMVPGVSVVRATSVLNPTKFATATVTVTQARVVITPAGPQTMTAAESRQFAAVVNDQAGQPLSDQRVDWKIMLPAEGTAYRTTSPYWYTAPASAGPVTLRATSVADPTAFLDVPINVQSYNLTISPKSAVVSLARYVQFTASPSNVIWSVKANGAGGTINTNGLYLAPQPASSGGGMGTGLLAFALDYVIATSALDSKIVASASIQVTPVLVSPERGSVASGATIQFSGNVMGTPTPTAVTWSAYYIDSNGVANDASAAISGTGLFTAPATKGTYKIRATAIASPVVYGEADVIVN